MLHSQKTLIGAQTPTNGSDGQYYVGVQRYLVGRKTNRFILSFSSLVTRKHIAKSAQWCGYGLSPHLHVQAVGWRTSRVLALGLVVPVVDIVVENFRCTWAAHMAIRRDSRAYS